MSKIIAVGTGPLLEKGVKKVGGQCLRTWHFVFPLLEHGHQVSLITLPIPDRTKPQDKFRESAEKRKFEGFPYVAVLKEDPAFLDSLIRDEIKRIRPDCVIGINTHPSAVAARSTIQLPFWADLNGWVMAEGQMRARLDESDEFLPYFWMDERDACRRADRFSTVSRNQKMALLGELAALGRLNRHTFDYPFADVVENAVNPMFTQEPPPTDYPGLRGDRIPDNSFIILWSGGYNTWTDVDLLYEALTGAMEKNDRIHFVSTGGSIDGHDEKTYSRFHKLLAASPHRKKFHLLGWVKAELLPHIYRESDIGINVDAVNYETLFGARNRITNMLAAGLPVISTLGTEISRSLKKNQIGLGVPLGDKASFSKAIIELAEHKTLTQTMSVKAAEYASHNYSYSHTTKPVREWVKDPHHATDNVEKIKRFPRSDDLLGVWINDVEKPYALLMDRNIQALIEAERDLATIRDKSLFKLYKNAKDIFKRS